MPSDKANVQPVFEASPANADRSEWWVLAYPNKGFVASIFTLPTEPQAAALAEALNNAVANAERCKVLEAEQNRHMEELDTLLRFQTEAADEHDDGSAVTRMGELITQYRYEPSVRRAALKESPNV